METVYQKLSVASPDEMARIFAIFMYENDLFGEVLGHMGKATVTEYEDIIHTWLNEDFSSKFYLRNSDEEIEEYVRNTLKELEG